MKKLTLILFLISGLVAPPALAHGFAMALRSGTSDPGTCQPTGLNVFINRNSTPVLKICSAANTWTGLLTTAGGTLTGPLLAPDGTAAAPSYSFASTGNSDNGMFLSAANAIGFSTAGTERWIINASGSLNPLVANTYSIGSSAVPVKEIVLSGGSGAETYNPGGLLASLHTSVATDDATEKTLQTYTLPASTLVSSGGIIKVMAWGISGANADTKTIRLYFGSTALTVNLSTTAPNGAIWEFTAYITRTALNTQRIYLRGMVGSTLQAGNYGVASAQTETSTIEVKVTGQSATATASNITCYGMTVEFLPAPV